MNTRKFSDDASIIIIGAGPVGICLALQLKQMGYSTTIFEKRVKSAFLKSSEARSVNITLSFRGLLALQQVGCSNRVKNLSTKVVGRTYHLHEKTHFVPYTLRDNYHLHSIKRSTLELVLLKQAERAGIEINFGHELVTINSSRNTCIFNTDGGNVITIYDFVFGCDGVSSSVRNSLHAESQTVTNPFVYLKIGITKENAKNLDLNNNSVNIWKDQSGMLLSLPNIDGEHSGLLHVKNSLLDQIYSNRNSLTTHFPILTEVVDDFENKFFASPVGAFKAVACSKWFLRNNILLMGDAAHSLVPFFGQGTNVGLEDVKLFTGLLQDNNGDFAISAYFFAKTRPKDTDAIAYLSLQNLKNLDVEEDFEDFLTYKMLDLTLESRYADYQSEYFNVAYSDKPFIEVLDLSSKYKPILLEYTCNGALKGCKEFSVELLEEIHSRIVSATSKQ